MSRFKTYLGDAVYAELVDDRNMIRLWTSNGIEEQAVIYLEDFVYEALVRWVKSMHQVPANDSALDDAEQW